MYFFSALLILISSITVLKHFMKHFLVKTFVQMTRRKYLNVSGKEMYSLFTPNKLVSQLDNGKIA